jgi:regulator of protease activity HflC (stomatin/prohibitin superfamily)
MTEILIGFAIIIVLLIIIFLPNITFVKDDEAVIIERLGKFHKIVNQKGFLITIPFVERIYETINLKETSLTIENKYFKLDLIYKIIDVKTFSYAHLNSKKQFINEISENTTINLELLNSISKKYGILIINNNLVYNENKEE